MADAKKPKKNQTARPKGNNRGKGLPPPEGKRCALIRIPDMEARGRAARALGEVPRPFSGFPDFQYLVTGEHLEVLRRERIPFELLA